MKLLVLLLMPAFTLAQSRQELLLHYKSMERLDSTARNALFKMRLQPNWQNDGTFWYSNHLRDSSTEYFIVDPAKGTKRRVADSQGLETKTTSDPSTPPRWRRDWRRDSLSPDKQWVALIKDDNVYIKSAADSNQLIQFTTDGTATQPYASTGRQTANIL